MTDEFYRCNKCGAVNEGNKFTYKINEELSQEELEIVEKALNRKLDCEEIERCAECGEVADFAYIGSTEDDR